MTPSLLQLDHYAFAELHLQHVPLAEVELVNGYPSLEYAALGSEAEFSVIEATEDTPEGVRRYGVRLVVHGGPKDENNPKFPYKFRVDAVGVFHGPDLPEDKREKLILVNGASLLFGAVREQLLSLTSRSLGPSLMLPTVRFDKLGTDFEERNKSPAP